MSSDPSPTTASAPESPGAGISAVERMVFGKNRLLWVGVAAVLVPLAVLLVLQYLWLADLERNSIIAREAALENYLNAITQDVDFHYRSTAETLLNLPPAAITEETVGEAADFFTSRDLTGAQRVFVITYQPIPKIYFYDDGSRTMVQAEEPTIDSRAVWVAVSPWSTLHKTLGAIRLAGLEVDEHDSSRRIILNPFTDANDYLYAIAGIIVDREHFTAHVLPDAIARSLPAFDDRNALWVCVRDRFGRMVHPPDPVAPVDDDRISRDFDFVFTDWEISLQGDLAVPERWARANFAINVTLSAALAVVLLGGVVFTVRTAIREMKLSAMKNEFVSNVSHELRTPLASIRVFGELMRHGRVADPVKVAEYGTHIETESRRLSQLINNILDFSRIESGSKIYSFESTDFEQLLAGTIEAYTVRLKDRGFELDYIPPAEPLPLLMLDSNAIDRAIANLLDNAVKYSKNGGRITVRLDRLGDEAVLAVTDQGIGIPTDEHDLVFDRFHRVSTGLVHDVKGTGLGLSLVRHIVDAHGGRVRLESELGKGSTFFIHLPVDRQQRSGKRGHDDQGSDR